VGEFDNLQRQAGTKKERRAADSHAPLSQLNQLFVYLRDHLLLDRDVDTLIVKSFLRIVYDDFGRREP
jgi:hypothetical protein